MSQADERRPTGAASEAWRPATRVTGSDVGCPVLTRAEVYEIIRGRLVAHVITKAVDGSVRVRPYRNLGAADRAVRLAVERGHAATVVMVRQDIAPLVGAGDGDR